jgi:hypothetical protein
VLVADSFGGKSNLLNFNVGSGVDLLLPSIFFSRLSAKYGSLFYVKDNGADAAVTNAVEAIADCLLSEAGTCSDVPKLAEANFK